MKLTELNLKFDPRRPVVFLDIDGVIKDTWITLTWCDRRIRHSQTLTTRVVAHGRTHVCDSVALTLLLSILDMVDAQVVIVSSMARPWVGPNDSSMEFSKTLFGDRLIGSIETSGSARRGEIVKAVVEANGITNWVVFDDSFKEFYEDKVFFNQKHLIPVDGRYGISKLNFEHALATLMDLGDWEYVGVRL